MFSDFKVIFLENICILFHLDNFLHFCLLQEVWITIQPPTELLLQRARKYKRPTLLLNPGNTRKYTQDIQEGHPPVQPCVFLKGYSFVAFLKMIFVGPGNTRGPPFSSTLEIQGNTRWNYNKIQRGYPPPLPWRGY